MDVRIFTKDKEVWTRFKISIKDIKNWPPELISALGKPERKSSRYYYWEKKGDYINNVNVE